MDWRIWRRDNAPVETRAGSQTDLLIELALRQASGQTAAAPAAIGALEAAAGLVGRAFAAAEVVTDSPTVQAALTPECLTLIGRNLIRRGESLFGLDTEGGALALLPAASYDVDGYPNPATWLYRLTVSGPSTTHTYNNLSAQEVIHCRYAVDPAQPWRGVAPLQAARLTGRVAAELLADLGDELSGPRTNLLGLPLDGDDATIAKLRRDIEAAAGRFTPLERGDWGGAPGGGEVQLRPERLGPNPPAVLAELYKLTRDDVLSACGVNPALVTDAPGVAQRESYRQFLFNTVAPLGRMVAAELSAKLGYAVAMDWAELRAADIAGRARAFGTMVSNGMELERAVALSGLLSGGDA